jgi:hypothetical protein
MEEWKKRREEGWNKWIQDYDPIWKKGIDDIFQHKTNLLKQYPKITMSTLIADNKKLQNSKTEKWKKRREEGWSKWLKDYDPIKKMDTNCIPQMKPIQLKCPDPKPKKQKKTMNLNETKTINTNNADSQKPEKKVLKSKRECKKHYESYWQMTRKEHMNWLAQPKEIRLKPWPDPELVRELPIKIEHHTLHGKIPPRIEYLARPKVYKPRPEPPAITPTINGYSKKRMEELAKPKSLVGYIHARCLDTEEKEIRYFNPNRYHSKITPNEAMKFREEWTEKNSKPKVRIIEFPERDKRRLSFQQANELTERLTKVSDEKKEMMAQKPYVPKREPRPPGKHIVPLNLPWIDRLSKPRKLLSVTIMDMEYDPYKISKRTLRAKATKRIIELARPKVVNTNSQIQFKENPYAVNPRALVYKATKRIKRLAQPRIRN